MASMSYCRFENTAIDFQACLNDLVEACSFNDLDHSLSEINAREDLYVMAKKFIKQYEHLMNEDDEFDLSESCF